MQQEGIEGIIQGEWQLLQDAAAAAAAAAGEGAPAEQPAQDTVVDQVPENVAAGN
jgi:penicillin-binding protein 1A